jgi:hypothetical protein
MHAERAHGPVPRRQWDRLGPPDADRDASLAERVAAGGATHEDVLDRIRERTSEKETSRRPSPEPVAKARKFRGFGSWRRATRTASFPALSPGSRAVAARLKIVVSRFDSKCRRGLVTAAFGVVASV